MKPIFALLTVVFATAALHASEQIAVGVIAGPIGTSRTLSAPVYSKKLIRRSAPQAALYKAQGTLANRALFAQAAKACEKLVGRKFDLNTSAGLTAAANCILKVNRKINL